MKSNKIAYKTILATSLALISTAALAIPAPTAVPEPSDFTSVGVGAIFIVALVALNRFKAAKAKLQA